MSYLPFRSALFASTSAVLAMAGCGPSTPAAASVDLSFTARVGAEPFECGRTYEGVGVTGTALTVSDLRFYVHDVRLVTSDGRELPVSLDQDDFQNGAISLLDFETGGSACEGGNAPTHTELTGTVAESGPFTALRFRLGVPEARNHLDSGSQPSPMNLSSMYWGWQGGYKFLRFEGRSTGLPEGLVFHLGATGCSGDSMAGTRTCSNGNRPDVEVALPAGFSPETHRFVVDVERWLAGVDLDSDAGGENGCMSGPMDPECPAWFESVGLPAGSTQTLVTVEAR
jgi:uncharacterized repeat protein (TIGR04052 family)